MASKSRRSAAARKCSRISRPLAAGVVVSIGLPPHVEDRSSVPGTDRTTWSRSKVNTLSR